MYKIIKKPFAKFMSGKEILNLFRKNIGEFIEEGDTEMDLYGIVIEIKAIDKIDNPKIFMEYCFGESKKAETPTKKQ